MTTELAKIKKLRRLLAHQPTSTLIAWAKEAQAMQERMERTLAELQAVPSRRMPARPPSLTCGESKAKERKRTREKALGDPEAFLEAGRRAS